MTRDGSNVSVGRAEHLSLMLRFLSAALFTIFQQVSVCGQEFPDGGQPYAQALQLVKASRFRAALEKCNEALTEDWSIRMKNEIQATAAKCCLMLNQRDEAIERIEVIYQANSSSSHVALIPLVWDEELPPHERVSVDPSDLHSQSAIRRLLAASALLHEANHQEICVRNLTEFRTSGLLPFNLLAETQLWRLKTFPDASISFSTIERWRQRLSELPEDMQAGPRYIVGRLLKQHQRMEDAALEFLWLPCMECHDPSLAASGLSEAITCLNQSGRANSAQILQAELLQWVPDTSAAHHVPDSSTSDTPAIPQATH